MNGAEPDKPPPPKAKDKQQRIQEQLDQALADSFPASDPVSIATSQVEEDWEEEKPSTPEESDPPR
jgi:hypothetical protein